MIDTPGPWGTGPFELTEGYSSISDEIAIISGDPFTAVWLPTQEHRTDRVVLEASTTHWNRERGPRLERIVFRNDIDPAKALELVCDTEGEVDIVTEVAPQDVARVLDSEHAHLVTVDAMRVLAGVINRGAEGVPLDDVRIRRALNLAVDRDTLVNGVFGGYASPLAGLTPHYAAGRPDGIQPYDHDPDGAKALFEEAGWPEGQALIVAATSDLAGIGEWLADGYRSALGIEVELVTIPDDQLLAAQRALVEKKLPLPFHVLVHAWFDLTSDAPPAVIHREFYHSGGAFRAGPPLDELEEMFGRFVSQITAEGLESVAEEIEQFTYDQALSVFLCAPQALYAINNHVKFNGHAATFELADTEVDDDHWSRR